jgi:hypothetical protein
VSLEHRYTRCNTDLQGARRSRQLRAVRPPMARQRPAGIRRLACEQTNGSSTCQGHGHRACVPCVRRRPPDPADLPHLSAGSRPRGGLGATYGQVLGVRGARLREDHRPPAALETLLIPLGRPQSARRPANARAMVSSSAYSRSDPAGKPCAGRDTVTSSFASRSAT